MVANVGETWPANDLERAFETASRDWDCTAEFQQLLLDSEVYVLSVPDPSLPEGEFVAGEDCRVKLVSLEDPQGRLGVAAFTSLSALQRGVGEDTRYVRLRGRVVFEMIDGHRMVLNRFGPIGCTLEPVEIQRLLAGILGVPQGELKFPKGSSILLGQGQISLSTSEVRSFQRVLAQHRHVAQAHGVAFAYQGVNEPNAHAIVIRGGVFASLFRDLRDTMESVSTTHGCPLYLLAWEQLKPDARAAVLELGTQIHRRPWWKWMPQKTWK